MSEEKLEEKKVAKKKAAKKKAAKKKASKKVAKKAQGREAIVGSFIYITGELSESQKEELVYLGECVETGKKLYKKIK